MLTNLEPAELPRTGEHGIIQGVLVIGGFLPQLIPITNVDFSPHLIQQL